MKKAVLLMLYRMMVTKQDLSNTAKTLVFE